MGHIKIFFLSFRFLFTIWAKRIRRIDFERNFKGYTTIRTSIAI